MIAHLRLTTAMLTLAASAFLAATPGQALTVGTATFTCPIDGKTFQAKVARSGTSFGMRLDTKRIGPIAQPWPMPACPGSGLPLYKRKFTDAEVAKLKALVATPAYRAARKGNTNYYVAAWVLSKLRANQFRVAIYYLRASWEAESGDKGRHRRYLETALRAFDAFLKNANPKSSRYHMSALLAANLERRLGRFDKAQARIKAASPHFTRDVYRQVAGQVVAWAAKRNDRPQKYVQAGRKPRK